MATYKNLPIKFFQKRQKDQLDTEGGGARTMPPWVDQTIIAEKSIYIRDVLKTVASSLSEKVKVSSYIPSVVKVKVNKEAIAKTYRKEIGNLFNNGKLNIIGISGEDELLIKIDNEVDLQKIVKNFEKLENAFPSYTNLVGISAISDIEEFKAQVDDGLSEGNVLKIKLFNYGNSELNRILARAFENYCRNKKIDFKNTSYSADLNIYRITGITVDTLDELKNFDGVQLVTEMPTYDITLDEVMSEAVLPIRLPEAGKEYPTVGILDTGIANIPHLAPWIHSESVTYYVEDDINKKHGTFVAGVLLYGDQLEGKEYTGFEGCKLFEAIVMPDLAKQKMYESELIEQIRDAVSRNEHIKIWNLSLGTDIEADLYEFSDFAKALDEIQEQHDVLICKSAGNCQNFKVNAPKGRITKSADTVRGIFVGSLAQDKNATDYADKHNPSPFSRKGPGPSYLIKPDVVHIGGNAGLNAENAVTINPVKSFSPDGGITEGVGTSFSTPRIAAIAAGLDFMLKDNFNATLLKALIIHSAKYPEEMKVAISDKLDTVGFGMPSNIQNILYNEPNEITLILQDTLEKGNFVDILDFPFPQSMIDEDGYYYGEITVTLVTAPILEVSQGAEYCQSNIDVMFGSYDNKIERDTSKPLIKNPIGAEGRQNILDSTMYSKKVNKNFDSAFSTERMLVAYGTKFQPVKKWSVNFDEFTDRNKEKFLKGPKNWYLKLKGLYRDFTESKCELQNITPSQEFTLIITIKDTKKRGNIYNEVTQMLDSFSFVHSNVKIREE
ncbi:MAG: hypothetical protein RL308_3281, partial [Bacteroidota bacterium]